MAVNQWHRVDISTQEMKKLRLYVDDLLCGEAVINSVHFWSFKEKWSFGKEEEGEEGILDADLKDVYFLDKSRLLYQLSKL